MDPTRGDGSHFRAAAAAAANSNIPNTIRGVLLPALRNPLGPWIENHSKHEHKTIQDLYNHARTSR